MTVKGYLLSFPERFVRAALGLGAGVAREVGEGALPKGIRRSQLCGMGRQLIPEMADALKAQGLLEQDAQFSSVDQMLDGLERTSSRLAAPINTPPLDVV